MGWWDNSNIITHSPHYAKTQFTWPLELEYHKTMPMPGYYGTLNDEANSLRSACHSLRPQTRQTHTKKLWAWRSTIFGYYIFYWYFNFHWGVQYKVSDKLLVFFKSDSESWWHYRPSRSLQLLYGFVQHQNLACLWVRLALQQYIKSFRTIYIEELRSVDPTSVLNPSV